MPNTPPLHTVVIFIAVTKRIKICYRGTNRLVAETLLYPLHTQIQLLLLHVTVKSCQNEKCGIFAQFTVKPLIQNLRVLVFGRGGFWGTAALQAPTLGAPLARRNIFI
jgi:hypothetical protein